MDSQNRTPNNNDIKAVNSGTLEQVVNNGY